MNTRRAMLIGLPVATACVLLGVALGVRGGGTADRSVAPTRAVTTSTSVSPTTVRVSTSALAPSTLAASTTSTTETPTVATTEAGRNLLGGDAPEDKLMPNVVCMELQKAQNLIQDHGVFYSKSVDASGKGRRQLIDRNWIVVAQKPEAGTKIGEGDAVLSVVKKGEKSPC